MDNCIKGGMVWPVAEIQTCDKGHRDRGFALFDNAAQLPSRYAGSREISENELEVSMPKFFQAITTIHRCGNAIAPPTEHSFEKFESSSIPFN
jgi:hypothetical protein